MLRKRSPFSLHEYGVRRGQEDWEDRLDGPDRTGQDMDGHRTSSGACSRQEPRSTAKDAKKKPKIPDRVTLKKEIGLLSACTIIIGEENKPAATWNHSGLFISYPAQL